MGTVAEFTQDNFDAEVLGDGQVALVDFWAPWCGPCRQLMPVIEELAADNEGTAKIGKVNTDEQGDLAMKYGVQNLPTLIVFKNGEPTQRFMGVQPKARLQDAINDAVA